MIGTPFKSFWPYLHLLQHLCTPCPKFSIVVLLQHYCSKFYSDFVCAIHFICCNDDLLTLFVVFYCTFVWANFTIFHYSIFFWNSHCHFFFLIVFIAICIVILFDLCCNVSFYFIFWVVILQLMQINFYWVFVVIYKFSLFSMWEVILLAQFF